MRTKSIKKYFWIVGIILFAYVLLQINWQEFFLVFKQAKALYFVLFFLTIIPILFLRVSRWGILTKALNIKIGFLKLSKMYMKAVYLGVITPAKAGEFYRAKYLADGSEASLGQSLWTVAVHRIIDLLDTLVLGAVSIIILSYLFAKKISFFTILALAGFALLFALGWLLLKKQKAKNILWAMIKAFIPKGFKEKTENVLDEMFAEMKRVNVVIVAKSFLIELLTLLLIAFSQLMLAIALGINIPFWYLLLIIPLMDIIIVLPISVLGIGSREISYAFLFSFFGITLSSATAFSLSVMVWSIFNSIPGLILHLFKSKNYANKE